VPKEERFRHAPYGACFERCLPLLKSVVSVDQQPKRRKIALDIKLLFLFTGASPVTKRLSEKVRMLQADLTPQHL
jgi:hypothetical protein